MKCVIGILLGLLSSQSHAQTDGFISPGDLAAAEAAQAEQERKDRLMWVLFDALDAVKAIEVTVQGDRFSNSLNLDDGKVTADPWVRVGSNTSCLVSLKNKLKLKRTPRSIRIRVNLETLDRYDLEKQTLSQASWLGVAQACNRAWQCSDLAHATLTCSIGWMNPLGTQPKSLTSGVVKYNLGGYARYP